MSARRKRGRLSRSGDFERVYRNGTSHANRFLVLYSFPSTAERERASDDAGGDVRLGISVGRKVGGAVQRNAVKRAIREAFWSLEDSLSLEHDYVVVARADSAGLVEREGTEAIRTALAELLRAGRPNGQAEAA